MKTSVLLCLALFAIIQCNAQIGIGVNPPDPSAVLQIQDTARGLLIPRMTAAQKMAIASPAEGLLVYQTNAPVGLWQFISGVWQNIGAPNNGGKHTLYLSDDVTDAEAQAIIATDAGPNTQEVRILRCKNLTNIDLSMITSLNELYVSDNPLLQNMNLVNLKTVNGGISIDKCPALTSFALPVLKSVGRSINGEWGLWITNSGVTSLNFSALTRITGTVRVFSNNALTSFSCPQLPRYITNGAGDFFLNNNSALTSIAFAVLTNISSLVISGSPSLATVNLPQLATTNFLTITGSNAITSIALPVLTSASGNLTLTNNKFLNTLSLPLLVTAGDLFIADDSALAAIALPSLTTVTTEMLIGGNKTLASATFPALATAGIITFKNNPLIASVAFPVLSKLTLTTYISDFSACTNLSALSLNALTVFSNTGFSATGCRLPSAQINALLNKFVNITPVVRSRTFNLLQTPAAPPTGQGIDDKATLVSRSNSVVTD